MKRNDWILIGIGLLASVVLFGWTQWSKKGEGGKAVVFVDKKEYAAYDLHKDGEYEIQTDRGNNWLVIQDGKADMVKADCPDKLCVKQKAIHKNGETIVCLPHRVVVEIQEGEVLELDGQTR